MANEFKIKNGLILDGISSGSSSTEVLVLNTSTNQIESKQIDTLSGISGESGLSGNVGISGISGTSGRSGISGQVGVSGTSGVSGQVGVSGSSGISGQVGTSGLSGLSGQSGFSGLSGQVGVSGTSGISGQVGISGLSGVSGTSGFSGISGIVGTSGLSGISGRSGVSGQVGTSGISGLSGFSGESGLSGESGQSGIYGPALFTLTTTSPDIALTANSAEKISNGGTTTFATSLESYNYAFLNAKVLTSNTGNQGQFYLKSGSIEFGFYFINSNLYFKIDGSTGYVGGYSANDILTVIVTDVGVTLLQNGSVVQTGQYNSGQFSISLLLYGLNEGFSNISFGYVQPGISGISGQVGTSGFSGLSGQSGFSGISGLSGISGRSGLSGFQGVQGLSGESGTSGTSGESGTSGFFGISGFSGESGLSGFFGISGFSGESGLSGFFGISGFSGESGISGQSGFSGLSGTSGFSGLSGQVGTSGFSGLSGTSGFSGLSGQVGISGLSGQVGTSGLSGLSGQSGFSGLSGSSGFSGLSGQVGTSGLSGTSGFSGLSGQVGTSGLSGLSGRSGISGFQGVQGFSGESGTSGTSGESGISGESGTSGFFGISGFSGESGLSGFFGFSGFSGLSGESGISGISGQSGILPAGVDGATPFYSGSSWVVNNTNIYNNGSIVGIGTTSPTAKLQLRGTGSTSSSIALRVEGSGGASSLIVNDAGKVAIGTNITPNVSNVYDLTTSYIICSYVNSGRYDIGGVAVANYTGGIFVFGDAGWNSRFDYDVVNIKNKLGVNISSPGARFHVKSSGSTSATYNSIFENGSNVQIAYMRDDGLFFTSLDRILMNETWVGKFGSGSNNLILGKSAGGTLGYNGGNNNISIGFQAGLQLGASAEKNVLIGTNVGYSMTSGSANMFLGYQAGLYTTTGGENMAIGVEAFRQNETGTGNVAIGSLALYTGISHVYNTGIGYQTGYLNTGDYGVFIGFRAGYNNGSGSNNTYLGSLAAYNMSTGSNNTVIGYSGATTLNNGSTTLTNATNGVYIGYQTRGNANSETNAIVIGYQANGLGSNTVVLGNDNITTTALKGNVGVGTTSPTAKLQVTGASGTLLAVDLATDRRVFSVGSTTGTYTGNILNVDSGYVTITGRVANGLALDVVPGGLFGIRTYGGTTQYSFLANRSDASTQVLRIGGDGTVTIGNVANSSTHTLQVRGFGASSATNAIYVTNTSAASLLTVRDDGNIGINTSAPGSLLTLNTSFASTNGLTISSDSSSDSQIIIRRAASKPVLGLLAFDTATYITNGVYYDGGNWIHHSDGNDNSILSFDPGVGASWYASNNGSGSWNVANNITLWDSTGYWKSLVRSTESGDSYFTGGNVGIGTSSPSVKLEVSGGDINFDSNTFYLDSTNNRVGIKTNSPQSNFHLDGTIRIDNQSGGSPSGPNAGVSPTNYWGTSSTDVLSTPSLWLKINLDGNDYYIPAYT